MKTTLRMVALCAALLCVAASFAQSKNPAELLASVTQFRTARLTEMRTGGGTIDVNALNAEVTAKAMEAIQGIDPTKVEATQAYAWAQLFSMAGKHKETCDLAVKYLTTNPSPDQKFAAQMMMLDSCNTLGEGDMIAHTLPGVTAPDQVASRTLFNAVVRTFSGTIVEDLGVEAGFKAIDGALAQVKFEEPAEYAKRMFASTKARKLKNRDGSEMTDEQITAQLTAQGRSVNDGMIYAAVDTKSDLLVNAGRQAEAVKLLQEFVDNNPTNASVGRVKTSLKQMGLVGSPATALNYGKQYGEFSGLDAWKGKVVIIDFTAHW